MIKKITALLLAVLFVLSFTSCGGKKLAETAVNDDNTLSPEDPTWFDVDDFIVCSGHPIPRNSTVMTDEKGSSVVSDLSGEELFVTEDSVLPCGIKIGDSFTEICSKITLNRGYGIYGDIGGTPHDYDPEDEVDFSEGAKGTLYVGYKVDEDKCVSIDSLMLRNILSSSLVSYKQFDIIMFSLTFNDREELIGSYIVYSDYGLFFDMLK